MGSVNNSVENHGNNSGFWVGINHGHIHLASEKLPVAADAAFNAHGNDHLGCLPGTRTEILDAINKWAKSTSRESIFCWVTGGAGTGKSSIASEAARTLDKEGLLGASFFFKRGGGDRGHAKRLFPTLAQQLAQQVSELKPLLANAIEENPDIAERSLKEQWERLCLRPLLALKHDRTIARVVVIDALDECDSEMHRDDLTTILQLLPQVQQAKSLLLRFVLTGRPERSIGLALGKTEPYLYRVNLNNVHQQAIDRDIFTFLEHRLSEIRAQHQLDNGWPGNEALNRLLDRARPLFIAAVTLCRFIGDANWDPEERLEAVLEDQTHYVSKLDEVYLPVLRQITRGQSHGETQVVIAELKILVGSIILLVRPLSSTALAAILGVTHTKIHTRLSQLYSFLDVPIDHTQPVRILHISFRDYLLDQRTKETDSSKQFWVDEEGVHQHLTTQCLRAMSTSLRKNFLGLADDCTCRRDVDPAWINSRLPQHLTYASRYWIHHLARSQNPSALVEQSFLFLQEHFLHWIEILSFQGLIYEVVMILDLLQSFVETSQDPAINAFLHDARRFILSNSELADLAPLQIYSSGLIFIPKSSIIRNRFSADISSWIRGTPMFEEYWGPGIQTLRSTEAILNSERRLREEVRSIVFSPDGRLLVSTHQEGIVEFWNATTGQHQQTVQTHSTCIRCTDLSEKGAVLAIGSQDGSIELWNTDTGECAKPFESHASAVCCVVFSPDGSMLAVAFEDGRLGVCDLTTGTQQYITRGDRTPHSLAFAAGGGLLISVDSYSVGRYTVEVFDAASMELLDLFESKRAQISWPQLSSDGRFLAFLAEGYIDIRSVRAKVLCGRLATRGDTGQMVFSRDCSMLAFNTSASKISLWNLNNGSTYEIDHGHPDRPEALAFSPNSRLLVSGYRNILKLWDLSIDQIQHASRPRYHLARWIVPSANGELLASGSEEGRVRLWNPRTGECTAILGRHKHMCTLYFSPCGNRIATGGKDSLVKLWNIHTRNLEASWDQNSEVVSIRFSPRGDILASNCSGGLIDLWELGHDEPKPLPQIQSQAGNDIAFVADGRLLVRSEENSIGLYNPRTSQSIRLIEIPEWRSLLIRSMMLSPDGRRVAFELDDNTIRVWDAKDAQFERTFTGTHAAWASRTALIHVYEREWLCVNGEKILWLPPQQRAAALAYKKGTLVIVHESGRFSMISCLY